MRGAKFAEGLAAKVGVELTLPQPIATAKVVHALGQKYASYCPKVDAALKADGRWAKLLPPT